MPFPCLFTRSTVPPQGPSKICVPLPRLTMALVTFCFLCNVKCRGLSNGLTCPFPICLLAFPSKTMVSNLEMETTALPPHVLHKICVAPPCLQRANVGFTRQTLTLLSLRSALPRSLFPTPQPSKPVVREGRRSDAEKERE